MKYKLYGDGLHDDTLAIQQLLDQKGLVYLPTPKKFYLISKPLEISSFTKLKLDRFAEIRLKENSNCLMLKNKTVSGVVETDAMKSFGNGAVVDAQKLYSYVYEYLPDHVETNIEIEGGIWNYNNLNQYHNPIHTHDFAIKGYMGICMFFFGVKNVTVKNLTFKDPVTYALMFDRASYFTVENVDFDFNYGNPLATNMDGVHLNGNCHYGTIKNLKGACYDDFVALNADEGSDGPITHIDIENLYAEDCHSAVRLLTVKNKVTDITIKNVHGTYFQYCIGFTKFYPGETTGCFERVLVDGLFASKAVRLPVYAKKEDDYIFPLIYLQEETVNRNVKISNVFREEENVPVETIYFGDTTVVDNVIIDNVVTNNYVKGTTMPIIKLLCTPKRLICSNLIEDGKEVKI